jgi:anti-anti-sigma factor
VRTIGQSGTGDDSVLVEVHVVPPIAMVSLAGDLDLHTQSQLRAMLLVIHEAPVSDLTIDLRDVDFVSLGVLDDIARAAASLDGRGGGVTLRGARPLHRQVLDLLGARSVRIFE